MENANFAKLTSMHFYGWKAGLKTGMYYLRTKAATDAIKFTLDKQAMTEPVAKTEEERMAEINCSLDDPELHLRIGMNYWYRSVWQVRLLR